VARTVDPLAGSYFVESLTDEIEERARTYLDEIDDRGGAARAVGYMQDEIHRAAYEHQLAVESGEKTVVGVNAFQEEDAERARIEQPEYSALEEKQREKLAALREERDGDAVEAALERVRTAAAGDDNLMPPIIEAVKALTTLGEISDALRDEWGTHDS
jgi:methylmalonyl-CoA mutase N-terminal domain/subunit